MSLAQTLIDCGAVKFGDFTLRSGMKSNYYVDIKRATMNPEVLRKISEAISDKLDDLGFTFTDEPFDHERYIRYAGMELGAVPIVVATALLDSTPYLIVRKAAKDHGTQQRIEGDFFPGDAVVVLEDVTTTGGASAEAVEELKKAGLEVRLVLTVVDRQQGAAVKFASLDVEFHSLVTAEELLQLYPNIEYDDGPEPESDEAP